MAPELGALILFVEHRYYGDSLPFGSSSFSNDNYSLLTIEQAMADYAEFLVFFKRSRGCSEGGCKTVLFGGSYGGMLAAWHRLRYPWLSVGAMTGGAPVDFYPGEGRQALFWNATLHTFRKYGSEVCADEVAEGVKILARSGATVSGRQSMGRIFSTCHPLSSQHAARKLLRFLLGAVASLAMIDYPYPCNFVTPLPANPLKYACASAGSALARLRAILDTYLNSTGAVPCYDVDGDLGPSSVNRLDAPFRMSTISMAPWNYQACTELILEPLTTAGLGFYPEDDDEVADIVRSCEKRFGTSSRPAWMPLSTGGSHAFNTGAITNIIFSNGEKDPWQTGVPYLSASAHPSVFAMMVEGAAHHEDLRFTAPATGLPVKQAKKKELDTIRGWLGLQPTGNTAAVPLLV
eukprot:gnl/TRDRNA2_/TRDRNA2_152328_c1_seq1.p1 gnl/TRDRNA2_/TRDRNA2_152328_c1~~gnl/TRDRNA2_/TRDRNA2_152328_c1_seq1.p1  ORF type:complete len:417 (+),score=62.22 gnl/TRDRNA2_/TRDRNA2_152328_c1_seq1:36-1253(+)